MPIGRWMLSLALCGCVVGASVDENPRDDDDSGQGELTDGSVIPMVPVDDITGYEYMDSGFNLPLGSERQSGGYLALAVGADYPTSLTLNPGEVWESRCLWEGEWTLERVESDDPSIIIATPKAGEVALEVVGAGTTTVTMTGTFDGGCPWEGQPFGLHPLERVYEVVVAEPDGATLTLPFGCDEPLLVSGGTLETGFGVVVTVDGEARQVANALPGRQATVTLDLPEGVTTELPADDEDFGALRFTGGEGSIGLSTSVGPFAELELVAPAAVTSMDLGWTVPLGNFGRDARLEDGETYSWRELYQADGRQVIVATGAAWVGERASCSAPSADWFDIDVNPNEGDIDTGRVSGRNGLFTLGYGAKVGETGPVRMRISAPDFNGGQGMETEVSVTFTQ